MGWSVWTAILLCSVHLTHGSSPFYRKGIQVWTKKLLISGGDDVVDPSPVLPSPDDWIAYIDASTGQTYYTNQHTGESTWEIPPSSQLNEFDNNNQYQQEQAGFASEGIFGSVHI